ncbi:MAG: phosphatidylserine/phosphatidylglycerophosphate/cardiolipin synthase family protein [Elusimicrobia bacterium]|nr:phosphatidylserine/phosphatidylglycerophosphate/cardiolipin synthase family protein [Elusimicrobiota bacterium]
MSFKYYLSLAFTILFVSVCFCSQKEQIDLAAIANYSITPSKVFVLKNKLFIDFGAKNLYLTLKFPKQYKKNEIKRLKLDAEKITKKEDLIEKVDILPTEVFQQIINELVIENGIKKDSGFFEYKYETDLGTTIELEAEITVSDTNKKSTSLKKELKTEKKADKEKEKSARESFVNTLKKYSDDQTKFLVLAKNIEGIVYIYVDTEKNVVIPLILPPYQKEEEDNNIFVSGGEFLYSFVVKNHIIPIIKSPFTSSYRLFSTASSSLMTFAPIMTENFYLDNECDHCMMNIDDFNKFLDEDLGTKEYKANIKFLIDGESFFEDFIETAKQATHSVFIQMYIFKTDNFSMGIISLLKTLARNIDVRVLIDYIGSLTNSKSNQDPIIKDYKKPKDVVDCLKEDSKIKVRMHPDTWLVSDHRKIFLIDRKKAYIGGMNIASEYRYTWHDLMVSLEGPVVTPIVKLFYKSWSFAGLGGDFAVAYRSLFTKTRRRTNKPTDDMINVRLLYTDSTDYQIYEAQLEAIRRAKKRIYIENPYFTEKVLVEELVLAKERGVDVKIILPGVNDLVIYDKTNLKIANYFIEKGIEVYLYPKMTHVKAAVYDNWACVGSANFNKLSMFKNREINVAFYDEKTVNELIETLFIPDFEVSDKYEKAVEIPFIYYLI